MITSVSAHPDPDPELRRTSSASWPRAVFVRSAATFALAFLITLTVHEFAHGLAALGFGLHPVVHATYESDVATSTGHRVTIALAGPVASALVGALVLALPNRGHGSLRQLQVWTGLLGLATFVGYLLTAPFLPGGDIGLALDLGGVPTVLRWVVLLVGAVGIIGLGALAARLFVPLAGGEADPDRRSVLRALGFSGWLGGAVLTLAAVFPPRYASIVFAIAFTGVFTMFIRFFSTRVPLPAPRRFTARSPVPVLAALVVVALVLRLVVDRGVTL